MSNWKKKHRYPNPIKSLEMVKYSITSGKLNIDILYKNYNKLLMYNNLLDVKRDYTVYMSNTHTRIYKSSHTINTVIKPGNYSYCDGISGAYTEHLRLNARYKSYESAIHCWYNNENFHKELSKNLNIVNKLKESVVELDKTDVVYIYSSLMKYTRIPTVFKPTWIVTIMKYLEHSFNFDLKIIKVLDPCAGWGCRLLSFISLECDYTGIDPNRELHSNYRQMIKDFGSHDKHRTYCIGFENYISNEKYDVVFTSPPFFDLEIYSDSDEQCYIQYRNKRNGYKFWLEEWMFPMINKMLKYLKPGGLLCLNVSNSKNLTLFDDVYIYLQSINIIKSFETVGLKNNAGTKMFPLLIYQKCQKPILSQEIEKIKDEIICIKNSITSTWNIYSNI